MSEEKQQYIFYSAPITVHSDPVSVYIEKVGITVRNIDRQPNKSNSVLFYGTNELIYAVDGDLIITLNGKYYTVHKNSFVLLRKFDFVQICNNPDVYYRVQFDVQDSYTYFLIYQLLSGPIQTLPDDSAEVIKRLFEDLISERDSNQIGSSLTINQLFRLILIFLMRFQSKDDFDSTIPTLLDNAYTPRSHEEILCSCCSMIYNHRGNITVAKLASLTFFSPSHLRRVFHETLGISPLELIRFVRMVNAEILLLEGTLPTVISTDLGFSSVHHFSREFKAYHGMSPKEFLVSEQKGDIIRLSRPS